MIKLLLIILLSSTCVLINSSTSNTFGLKTTKGEALELLELTTKAIVEGPYAEIQYIQTYKNPLDHAVELSSISLAQNPPSSINLKLFSRTKPLLARFWKNRLPRECMTGTRREAILWLILRETA